MDVVLFGLGGAEMDSDIMYRYYRSIFENSNDAIFLTSPDGDIFKANAAACEMFRKKEYEIRKHGYLSIFDHKDPRLDPALRKRSIDGKIKAELSFLRGDGSTFTGDCLSVILSDEDNRTWTVTIIRDMSADAETIWAEAGGYAPLKETHDRLTGLLNRNAFLDAISREINRATREQKPLSILLLDIDNYRELADQVGYKTANEALRKLAAFLSVSLRNYDILGRYEENEFIICLPGTDNRTAEHVAILLEKKIKALELDKDGVPLHLSVSIGAGTFSATSRESINALILKANQRLFRAKAKTSQI
jgi:diguanylate cyclase (GGDEF)-like protein/PAS domain S-box-containing protein